MGNGTGIMKFQPGQPCCSSPYCELLKADFSSLQMVQSEWDLRAGSWDDVDGTGTELELQAAGVELLATEEPAVSPYGVKTTVSFRGRAGSVIRFFAGADADVSVSAEVTLGTDCGQLRFYEQSLSGETRVGDVHWIRELRGEEWHVGELCYDPARGYLTMKVTTLAGETQSYTALIGSTGAAGYGVGTVTDTAEFRSLTAAVTGHILIPMAVCGSVAITTTQEGRATPQQQILSVQLGSGDNVSLWWSYGAAVSFVIDAMPGGTESTTGSYTIGFDPPSVVASTLEGLINTALTGLGSVACSIADGVLEINYTSNPPADLYLLMWLRVGGTIDTSHPVTETQPYIPARNEIQAIAITGGPTGGTFTLTFSGQTTGAIAFDADAATVRGALESLSNIGSGNVSVTGVAMSWLVEFVGTLAATDVPQMTASGSFTGCPCSYSYGAYDPSCYFTCASCDPSCSLAGSAFSGTLSDCDWDGVGYAFSATGATGTGSLEHRTEIYTIPLAATAAATGIEISDFEAGYSYSLTIAGITETATLKKSGTPSKYYVNFTVNGTTVGKYEQTTFPASIWLRVCRSYTSARVTVSHTFEDCVLSKTETLLDNETYYQTYPTSLSVTTDDPEVTWTSIHATKQFELYAACSCYLSTGGGGRDPNYPRCSVPCTGNCKDDKWPSAFIVDSDGMPFHSYEVPNVGCRYDLQAGYIYYEYAVENGHVDAGSPMGSATPFPTEVCNGIAATMGYYEGWTCTVLVSVLPSVLGVDLWMVPSHIGSIMIGYGDPSQIIHDDHYYTVVLLSIAMELNDSVIRRAGNTLAFLHDHGPDKPDCMVFTDLPCTFYASGSKWKNNFYTALKGGGQRWSGIANFCHSGPGAIDETDPEWSYLSPGFLVHITAV